MTRWLAVAFAVGAGVLQQQARLWTDAAPVLPMVLPGAFFWCLLPVAGAALLLAALRARGPWGGLVVVVLAFALGFSWAHVRAQMRLAPTLPFAWEGRDVVVSGIVRGLPVAVAGIGGPGLRFDFEVDAVETPAAQVPRQVSLTWYTDQSGLPDLRPGERWRWVVRLKRPHGGANPHGFDVERWLLEQGLRATGTVRPKAMAPGRLPVSAWDAQSLVDRARDAIARHVRAALAGAPYAGVIVALVVGEQRGIANEDWTLFNRTGIGHLLSISGLHITMLAALAAALAARVWRWGARRHWRIARRYTRGQASAALGWWAAAVYTVLAGFAVPAQRTLWMLSVVALAMFVQRGARASFVLAGALGIVVLLDPWAVDAPGFWLSFGAVAALMYAGLGQARKEAASNAGAEQAVQSADRETPVHSASGGEGTPGARSARVRLRAWGEGLRLAARAQLAVTLALAPLTMFFFQQVSVVSPLANALAIPVVSFIVTPLALLGGMVGTVFGIDWPLVWAHAVFAWLADPLGWLGRWSWASVEWPAPAGWTVALALAGLAWLAAPRGVPGRWAGLGLMLPLALTAAPPPPAPTFRATVFDVGQGMAVLIETAGHRLLYDTGPRYNEEADAGNRVVLPHLRASGMTQLDAIVLSHRDLDHAGGLRSLLAERRIDRVISPLPDEDPLLAGVRMHQACAAGLEWAWDGVRFEVLHPLPEAVPVRGHSNGGSCVLRVGAGSHALLLAGDIEAAQEAELAARVPNRLQADAVLAPHHGSASSSSAAFLAAVRPRLAIFQAGYRNRFGHPRPAVLARYQAAGAELARTDQDGAILLFMGPDAWRVERWRDMAPHYWQDPR